MSKGWIGVDLDGTLAEYHGWNGGKVGAPIPRMLERVKEWLAEGKEVRIFTARASRFGHTDEEYHLSINAVWEWCKLHLGRGLPITCEKDLAMIELWDDRCVQVLPNTGETLLEEIERLEEQLEYAHYDNEEI